MILCDRAGGHVNWRFSSDLRGKEGGSVVLDMYHLMHVLSYDGFMYFVINMRGCTATAECMKADGTSSFFLALELQMAASAYARDRPCSD